MCKDFHCMLFIIEKDWKPLVPIIRRQGPGNAVCVDCKGHAETECKRFTKTMPTKEKEKRRNWAKRPLKHRVDLLFWNQQKLLSREIVFLTADTRSVTGWSAVQKSMLELHSYAELWKIYQLRAVSTPLLAVQLWASSSPSLAQESPTEQTWKV